MLGERERSLRCMLGEENEPPYLRPCGPQEPSPRTLHFVPLGGPTSVVATPAALGSLAAVVATPAPGRRPVGSPRAAGPTGGKVVTCD